MDSYCARSFFPLTVSLIHQAIFKKTLFLPSVYLQSFPALDILQI